MVEENSNIGKQIGGSYRLVAELGGGSFGDVYKGQHIVFTNRPPVAIKLLHAFLKSPKERDQFLQEAQLLNTLIHPHILPILDAGIHEGLPYIVMEYAVGGSLQERLDRKQGLPMELDEALTLVNEIGEALHYAHQQNIVHRDLKPDNILFNAKGEALLADFGLAAVLSSARTRDMGSGGTPAYMAPEVFEGKVSVKSDQYALGCIAYELVTGRKPFDVEGMFLQAVWYQHAKVDPVAPTRHNSRIASSVEQAILRAMAKERSERHTDVHVFLAAIQPPPALRIPQEALPERLEEIPDWLEEILATPLDAAAHTDKGDALYDLQRYEEALVEYEQAIHIDRSRLHAYNGKGNALHNLKRYREALITYEQAINLNSNDAVVYSNKAGTLNKLKRYKEALAACEQALYLDPGYSTAYNTKGNALSDLKRYEEALAAYEQALRLEPNDVVMLNNKGNTLFELKRYPEALAIYEQVIRLDPNNAVAYNGKGNSIGELGRNEEALAAYKQALRLDPNDAATYSNICYALAELGKNAEALIACEQALRLDPNYSIAYNNKGATLNDLGRYQEALVACEQAIRLDPEYANSYHHKGFALQKLGHYQEALVACAQALRLDPSYARAYHTSGVILERLGRQREAREAYKRAEQLGYRAK